MKYGNDSNREKKLKKDLLLELSKILVEELTGFDSEAKAISEHTLATEALILEKNNLNSSVISSIIIQNHNQPLIVHVNKVP